MTFSTKNLSNGRVLVKGADIDGNVGQIVVDGAEWAALKQAQEHSKLHEAADDAINAFFAPLHEALDQLIDAHKPSTDPLFYVVLEEGQEKVEGKSQTIAKLSQDSAILRLIEEDARAPRLVWITGTDLEILEAPAPLASASVAGSAVEDGDVVSTDEATA